ncbi:Eco57I restriction-modification methylase domain-containing protein [Chelatococcus reniformis]|uniref:site-specific DNA-methyltransferase (adenine-specific) n=1 Tax=Chelatococcus reniformis TaxID=1494448 RepID=A0A916XAI7_9HYPH|nr:N-6 DNA methylase [Chelatococcus reniformis]GGC58999.1 RNA methyltransferase [Chelatococcus reniformis]
MGKRASAERGAERQSASAVIKTLDHDIARALSRQIAESHRLAFARSFTLAVVQACRDIADLPQAAGRPQDVELLTLAPDALSAAMAYGHSLAKAEPRQAGFLAGTIYTTALPAAYRASHGIFYTPPQLVDRLLAMADDASIDWRSARILDPACGGGAFLAAAALRMVAALEGSDPAFVLQQIGVRLHGFELDPFGAWLAQASVELVLADVIRAAGRPAPRIVEVRDSLGMAPGDIGRFDLVIGNPPYGRVTLAPERRACFSRSVYGHANLYGLFTDAGLRWTRPGGVIAFVTPTSMLSGLYYKSLRGLLAAQAPPIAVAFVHERAGVFEDVLQETILATYRRGGAARSGKVGFIAQGGTALHTAGGFALPAEPEAPWLLPRRPDQVALTRRLRAMRHRLADYGYGVSTGPLVWNRFKDRLQHAHKGGCYPVVWAESVTSSGQFVWRSEKRNHAPWFEARLPRDKWLIVTRPCVLVQRTTAKEQPRRLIAAEMSEAFIGQHGGVVVENHLNMVRALGPDPRAPAAVIAALLNNAAVDAAFRCINGSVAVSAFELEELPLPAPTVMARLAKLVAAGAPAKALDSVIAAAYARGDAAVPS